MHLHALFQGAHAYLSPSKALAGVSPDTAMARVNGSPHAIAEIVAHMGFWQRWFLDRCNGVSTPMVAQAHLGWPAVPNDGWDAVRDAFEADFTRALALADDTTRVDAVLSPAIDFPPLAGYTVRDALTHIALHNAHHLGQVITLRQQLGVWPPPAGSWTW